MNNKTKKIKRMIIKIAKKFSKTTKYNKIIQQYKQLDSHLQTDNIIIKHMVYKTFFIMIIKRRVRWMNL